MNIDMLLHCCQTMNIDMLLHCCQTMNIVTSNAVTLLSNYEYLHVKLNIDIVVKR